MYRRVVVIIGLYTIPTLGVLSIASHAGPVIPGITPLFVGIILGTDLTTSFLLFTRFHESRTWSLLLLGCAYLYGGLMAVLHLLTFPDAVLPGRGVAGTPQSTAWTYLLWMGGYAGLTLVSAIFAVFAPGKRIGTASRTIGFAIAAALIAVSLSALTAIVFVGFLPPLLQGASWSGTNLVFNAIPLTALTVSLVLLLSRRQEPLFLWLSVAIAAMLFANIVSLESGGRYTVGWTFCRLNWALSSCVLFLFFMGQFATQQRMLSRANNTLEQRVSERTADLTKTIRQRDVLLREVYHRVTNNLQVVDALIHAESRHIADAEAKEGHAELRNRVFALGLVHQQLMSSENLETFSIEPFLCELSCNLARSLAADGVDVMVEADPVAVSLDFAIPLGLLITELVSAAIKDAGAPVVKVEFRRMREGGALLIVADNVAGVEGDGHPQTSRSSLRRRIIAGLTRQLDGRMETIRQEGTRVEIRMPLAEEI